jgi:glycogen operon protein
MADDSFVVLFNSQPEPVSFLLPPRRFGTRWELALSTAEQDPAAGGRTWPARGEVPVGARSVSLLRRAT